MAKKALLLNKHVIIEKPAVIDIGLDRTILDPTRKWPKRRKTNAPTGLKRLWKHIKKLKCFLS